MWLYVRKSNPYRAAKYGVHIDLANLKADVPGKGAFTAFLDAWESQLGLYVECVQEERLVAYLRKRGYGFTENKCEYSPDMYRKMS